MAQKLRRGGRVHVPTKRYAHEQGAPTGAEAAAEEDVDLEEENDDALFGRVPTS